MMVRAMILLALLAVLGSCLGGCTSTRTESASIERTRGIQAGQPTVPALAL